MVEYMMTLEKDKLETEFQICTTFPSYDIGIWKS